jgi:hypothetical protein
MSFVMVLAAVIAIVLLLIGGFKRNRPQGWRGSTYKQKGLLSNPEQVMYWRLVEAYGNEKVIFSQVAFSQLIGVHGGTKNERYSKFAKARQKVADFVICNKDFSLYAIVEVDDKTHDAEKDAARDAITKEAGIKTFRFEVKSLPDSKTLRKAIDDECLYIGGDRKEDTEFTF